MAWKKKEKPLTPEEAIALAKNDLKPFWYGSEPLIAGIRNGDQVNAFPLDPKFSDKPWLIFFIDPTELSGESTLGFAREWYKRYSVHNLGVMLVCRLRYPHLRTPEAVQKFIRKQQISFPLVLDADESLSLAFRADTLPKICLFFNGGFVFDRAGKDWLKGTELEIQRFLRSRDPGLPLSPVLEIPERFVSDQSKLEFGRGMGIQFPAPGFTVDAKGIGSASFRGERPKKMKEGGFFIQGNWMQDPERVATSDPSASLSFVCPSSRFSVVAESLARPIVPAKLIVEVNGIPAYDAFAGESLTMDDDGQSLVRVEGGQIYHALSNLPGSNREITLRFPTADRVPIAIYGVRFGE